MKKIIKHGKEARELLKSGVDKSANIIKTTLGPSGRNVLIGRPYQYAEVTNDGVTIAKEVYLDNEIEQLGAEKVKEIASFTDDKAGDGTTTATVLAQAILNVGFDKLNQDNTFTGENIDPILIKREIDKACEDICAELDKKAKKIETLEDMEKVAFVSVEDHKLSKMIAEMYFKIGKNGIITLEDGVDDVESEIVEGLEIEAGLTSEHLYNEDKTYTLKDPLFLVTNHPINFAEQITPITKGLAEKGIRDLIILADTFSQEILKSFLLAKLNNQFNIIAVKTPHFGRPERMQDLAIALGATFVDKDTMELSLITREQMGKAKKVIIDKNKTLILQPKGNTLLRIQELTAEESKAKSKFDKEQLKKRIAKISGAMGVIRVGADTDTGRLYLKKKLEDAINATKYALQEGVIKGGGLALMEISDTIKPNILSEAIKAPYNQIQLNCGGKLEIGEDIIDPVRTTKTALRNACNVAGLIITTEVAIADKYIEPKDYKLED